MTPSEIEHFFRDKIPLTRAMALRVESWGNGRLILTAPLAQNYNHLGTAFGGSLNALAMLAGYGLIWLALDDGSAHVVIRRGTTDFRKPVRGDLRAVCTAPPEEELAAFRERYQKAGKARITLRVIIEGEDGPAMEFLGEYVAVPDEPRE
jgi:thioesterase domain-containing protein